MVIYESHMCIGMSTCNDSRYALSHRTVVVNISSNGQDNDLKDIMKRHLIKVFVKKFWLITSSHDAKKQGYGIWNDCVNDI